MSIPFSLPLDADVEPPQVKSEKSVHASQGPICISNAANYWGILCLAFGLAPLLVVGGVVLSWALAFGGDAARLGSPAERFIFPAILLVIVGSLQFAALRVAARTLRTLEFAHHITLVSLFHRKEYQWQDLLQIMVTPVSISFIYYNVSLLLALLVCGLNRDWVDVELTFSDNRHWKCRMSRSVCEQVSCLGVQVVSKGLIL